MFYSKKRYTKLVLASALLLGNFLDAQEMKFTEHSISCFHKQKEVSSKQSSPLLRAKNLKRNEDFIAELMKKPKTCEFIFVYEPEWIPNLEIQEALKFTGEILGREIISSIPIEIRVGSFSNKDDVLASATFNFAKNFPNAPLANTNYPVSLANAIAGERLTESSDIRIDINIDTNFYTGIDANAGDQFDIVTVLMHEFCHGLGFSYRSNGIFFNQFTDSNSNLLRDLPVNGAKVEMLLQGAPLLNTPSKPSLEGKTDGRSLTNALSHLSEESSAAPNQLMNRTAQGDATRDIGPVIRNVFRNMGYKLTVDAIANNLFVNIPNVVINPQLNTSNTANITLKNIGDTTDEFKLKEVNNLIELPTNIITLQPGETRIIKGRIDPNTLENRSTLANVQIIRNNQVSRNIPVNITNETVVNSPAITLSATSIETDVVTNAFAIESINVTNTGNTTIRLAQNSTSPNIQVSNEIIELKPDETKSINLTLITNEILPDNTINGAVTFANNETLEVLQELSITTNVIAPSGIVNVSADDLNFNLIVTPEITNKLIERTITINNVSNASQSFEIRALNDFNESLIEAIEIITIPANTSKDVSLIVDAEKLGNINLESNIEVLNPLTGDILSSSFATFNIEGIIILRIDLIEDFNGNNRLIAFEEPLILGEETQIGITGTNTDGSPIATVTDITASTDDIILLDFFTEEDFFEYFAAYTPTTLGPINETLSIILKDDPENPITIRITGQVIEKEQAIASLSLNNISVNNSTNTNINSGALILSQDEILVNGLRLDNIGDINLNIVEIQSSNPSFRVSTDINTIPSGESATVSLFFKPNAIGALTSQINIITNDPNTPSITFTASGIGKEIDAFITENPSPITVITGGTGQANLAINNTSLAETEYSATPIVNYEEIASNIPYNDITTSGVNITDTFRSPFSSLNVSSEDYHFVNVRLPFKLTYFGRTQETISITPYGFVNIINISQNLIRGVISESRVYTTQLPENDGPINSMASLGFINDMYSADIAQLLEGNAEVFYKINEDHIIVQWNNLAYNTSGDSINGQIIIYKNGVVDVVYGNVDQGENIENLVVGIENLTGTKGVQSNLANTAISSNTSKRYAPINSANFITNITPIRGRINPESQANLLVEISAARLAEGSYTQQIQITDTDSGHEELVDVTLNVIKGESKILINNQDTIQFNLDTIDDTSETQFVEISNSGTSILNISDINTTTEDFIVNVELPLQIPVGTTVYVPVTYKPVNRLMSTHEGQLIITSDDAFENDTSSINLIGNTALTTLSNTNNINSLDSKIMLYPNPTVDNINIKLGTKHKEKELTVTLFNIAGQNVLTKKTRTTYIKLAVTNLPQGNYIINLKDNTGQTLINAKFIKN